MKKVLSFVLFLVLLLTFSKHSFAAENFRTDYNVKYTILPNATTHVDMNVVLTNLTDQYYASLYKITVGFADIKNVIASDDQGKIDPKITQEDKGEGIELSFNDHPVGINNKLFFTISFDTDQIAQNLSSVWEINIPGISSQNNFSTFNVTVSYPPTLGKPTYIKPKISENSQQVGNLYFTKDQLGLSGISLAFGDSQNYKFDLTYHLQNQNLFPIKTELALPPSTNYQETMLLDLNPKPLNITLDKDGNWLAQYYLQPSQKLDVEAIGKIKVYLSPKNQIITKDQIKDYLAPKTYWESQNPKIKETAQNLKTPKDIYNFVVNTLNYDFERAIENKPRLGAVSALKNPNSAVCLEFTDLFIALARASGIPAREVDGFAYTQNSKERPLSLIKDVLHAWPEYYDFNKKAWVMVDPTWGKTAGTDYFDVLDFDHISFVVKGENSDYPIPAGGYKLQSEKNLKDVNVEISSSFENLDRSTIVDAQFPSNVFPGFPIFGTVKIENKGNAISLPSQLIVNSNSLTPINQTINVDSIPPYGFLSLPISFNKTPFLTNSNAAIKITNGNNTYELTVKISPFFINKWYLLGGITVVGTIIIIFIIIFGTWRLLIFRQRRQDNLRRESEEFKK